jgi:hypothetical protein
MMKRRALRYAAAHDALPSSLIDLPPIEGYSNDVTDGWRRPILWRVEGDEATLTSYGRDGVAGGTGEDADMIGIFQAKSADGRWAAELSDWRVDPFGRRLGNADAGESDSGNKDTGGKNTGPATAPDGRGR